MSEIAAFVFPGQGTQRIGMGADLARDFPVAKKVFEEVDETLHQKLSALMFSGDISELTQTQNAQPAIMAVSIAVFRVLMSEGVQAPKAVAGHSLGEYSALCAADVLSLEDTAKLLKARGRAMTAACTKESGGMMALLGTTVEQACEIAQSAKCFVANDNAPGQIVLSGSKDSLKRVQKLAESMGIKRVVPLRVEGAFHCPLMQSAADEMQSLLTSISFKAPKIPVYFDVTATCEKNPQHYANLLSKQIVAPVKWRELIENIRCTDFIECGPGKVLSGLIQRILPNAQTVSIETVEDVKRICCCE